MASENYRAPSVTQSAELAEQQGVWPFVESPGEFTVRLREAIDSFHHSNLLGAVRHVLIEKPPTLAATGKQQVGDAQANAPLDVTDPWRGLYLPASMPAPSEYGDLTHPDIPLWPDEREDALDKLVHAQGFDFHIVAGDFTEAALEDGDDLYWQEMRAWNPEAPEGEWRLAWKGDTEDGPYAWFVRPMALRPDTAAPPAQGVDLGQLERIRNELHAMSGQVPDEWIDPIIELQQDVQKLIDGQRDAAPRVNRG